MLNPDHFYRESPPTPFDEETMSINPELEKQRLLNAEKLEQEILQL
jgi:hypothetical protein